MREPELPAITAAPQAPGLTATPRSLPAHPEAPRERLQREQGRRCPFLPGHTEDAGAGGRVLPQPLPSLPSPEHTCTGRHTRHTHTGARVHTHMQPEDPGPRLSHPARALGAQGGVLPSGVLSAGGPCGIVGRALTSCNSTSASHSHTGQSQGPGMGGTEQTAGRRGRCGPARPRRLRGAGCSG